MRCECRCRHGRRQGPARVHGHGVDGRGGEPRGGEPGRQGGGADGWAALPTRHQDAQLEVDPAHGNHLVQWLPGPGLWRVRAQHYTHSCSCSGPEAVPAAAAGGSRLASTRTRASWATADTRCSGGHGQDEECWWLLQQLAAASPTEHLRPRSQLQSSSPGLSPVRRQGLLAHLDDGMLHSSGRAAQGCALHSLRSAPVAALRRTPCGGHDGQDGQDGEAACGWRHPSRWRRGGQLMDRIAVAVAVAVIARGARGRKRRSGLGPVSASESREGCERLQN